MMKRGRDGCHVKGADESRPKQSESTRTGARSSLILLSYQLYIAKFTRHRLKADVQKTKLFLPPAASNFTQTKSFDFDVGDNSFSAFHLSRNLTIYQPMHPGIIISYPSLKGE